MDGYDGDDEYDHHVQGTKRKWSQILGLSKIMSNTSKYLAAPILTLSTAVLLGLAYYTLLLVVLPFYGKQVRLFASGIATFVLYSSVYFYIKLLKTPPGTPPPLASRRGNNSNNNSTQQNASLGRTTVVKPVRRAGKKPRNKKKGRKKSAKGIDITLITTTSQFPSAGEYNGEDTSNDDNNDDDDNEYGNTRAIYMKGRPGEEEDLGICYKCSSVKVPRSHHCKTCGKCVLKMDHHCPWIGKCVGYFNYRFYLMFLFYVGNFCFVFITLSLPPYLLDSAKLNENPHYSENMLFFLITMSACLGISVFILCSFHLLLICTNQTTIEFFKNLRGGPIVAEGRVVPRKSRFDLSANPYNIGEYRNIRDALNVPKNGWIILSVLPNVSRPPTGDGCSFKHSKKFQQINCV